MPFVFLVVYRNTLIKWQNHNERIDIMKTTENKITKGLETIKKAKFNAIEEKVADLKGNFINEQVKSFNVDLGNKNAQQTIMYWETALAFQLCTTSDRKELVKDFDETNEEQLAEATYYMEVERIANRRMQATIRPITIRTTEMLKAILKNDLTTFNVHMKTMFSIELSQANFDRLKDITLSGNKRGLNTLSSSQFANTFMHLMLARAVASGNYSPKKMKGCLAKAINDVPTLTFDQAMNLDTLTVENMVKACNIKTKKDDTFMFKADKVRSKLHTSIAVKPMSLVKETKSA